MTQLSPFECPICMETYSNSFVPTTFPCGHSCCLSHANELNKTCFYCKGNFNPRKLKPTFALLEASVLFSKYQSIQGETLLTTSEDEKKMGEEMFSSSKLDNNTKIIPPNEGRGSSNSHMLLLNPIQPSHDVIIDSRFKKYSEQLMQLAEIGFTNFDQCVRLLEENYDENRNNIEEITLMLLSLPSEESRQNQLRSSGISSTSIINWHRCPYAGCQYKTKVLSTLDIHVKHHCGRDRESSVASQKTPKTCGHTYCDLAANQCCGCLDKRPHDISYERYVDGSGIQKDVPRNFYYCPGCKNNHGSNLGEIRRSQHENAHAPSRKNTPENLVSHSGSDGDCQIVCQYATSSQVSTSHA